MAARSNSIQKGASTPKGPTTHFDGIDWNFSERVSHSEIEGIHPYPAKFIAELPRALIALLPPPTGTVVFDPFCGSGTTLQEAQSVGIPSVGVDLNPIACLISRVKTSPVPGGLAKSTSRILFSARDTKDPPIPTIPNLDHWFKPDAQRALAALMVAIKAAPEGHRDILSLAASSIIVRVSNQDSDTRYAAVEKDITAEHVFAGFKRAVERILRALASRPSLTAPVRVIQSDTLALTSDAVGVKVGLVITSPPYPNAYEYWLYHKYRMWWLGFDPLAVKEREIGARAHFFKQNHHTADDFVRQMSSTFELLRNVVVRRGYACFVVGRSKIHGEIVDNAQIIEDVAANAGFVKIYSAERVLSPNRKSFNLAHANIKTETVLVLQSQNR